MTILFPQWDFFLLARWHLNINTGAHFTNNVSIAIQILWKIRFSVTQFVGMVLLHNFKHNTTVQLSYHMQNFAAINLAEFR